MESTNIVFEWLLDESGPSMRLFLHQIVRQTHHQILHPRQ